MKQAFLEVWKHSWVRVAFLALLLYLLFQTLPLLKPVLVSGTLAFLIAYTFRPMLDWLQARRVRRGIGIVLVLLVLLGMVWLLVLVLLAVAQQLGDFLARLPELVQSAIGLVQSTLRRLSRNSELPMVQESIQQLSASWQDNVASLSQNSLKWFQEVLSRSGTLLVNFTGFLVQGLLTLILAIYLMADEARIRKAVLAFFPEHMQTSVKVFSSQVGTAVGGYLRGQFTIAFLEGVLVWIGLALIGIPGALALGFAAGLFGMVPYLGVIIAIVPALLVAFSMGWTEVGLVVLVFVIANQLEGNVLSPWILGRTTNLHPVTVLLSLLIGVELFGVWGTVLAVPIAALGKLLLQNYYFSSGLYRNLNRHILHKAPPP